MKNYYQEFKTIKGCNGYLRKIGLEDFEMDPFFFKSKYFTGEDQTDGWMDSEETQGASITITKEEGMFALSVYKYTHKDFMN